MMSVFYSGVVVLIIDVMLVDSVSLVNVNR